MATKIFSTLNQNALGPGLIISNGGLVVSTTLSALSNARKVFGTLPQGAGDSYFERQMFTQTQPAIVPADMRVGVAQPTSSLSVCAGEDALSWAYDNLTGNVRNNAVTGATVAASPERTVIGIYTSIAGGNASMSVILNGSYATTVALPLGKFWVPCVTVCGGNAADYAAYINFGQTGFVYPQVTAGI